MVVRVAEKVSQLKNRLFPIGRCSFAIKDAKKLFRRLNRLKVSRRGTVEGDESMAVPGYESMMLPLLQFAARKGTVVHKHEMLDALAEVLNLTDEDRMEMLPSGIRSTFSNRAGWAITYLKKAGLLASTQKGYYQITDRGRGLLKKPISAINVKLLEQYPEFLEFKQLKRPPDYPAATPSEALEAAYENLRTELADELLSKLKTISPAFFERVVVELLVKMGYGGSRADAGKAVGRSGDGGIDGIIKEDKLGLDVVYIQAKRWDNNSVGRPGVMQFAGALQAQRANKGVFITTTRFTDEARNYVSQIGSKIVLIDGAQLTNLMIEHDVGVSTVSLYPVKRIDNDYFEE